LGKSFEKMQVLLKSDKNNEHLHEVHCTFLIIAHLLLRMRNVADKSCRENRNTQFVFNNYPPSPPAPHPENCAVYEMVWKSTVELDGPQKTMWCMPIACWIPEVTNAHSEYGLHIAFPLQQWLHEHSSVLRYTYIACLVNLWIDPGFIFDSC
jgi:hypothetical protein